MGYDFKHFENSLGQIFCTIRYHERLKTVTVTWKGTAQVENLRTIKDELIKIVKQNNTIFLLNDVQDLFSAATTVVTEFIRLKWDDEVFACGVKYIFHVIKPDMEIPLLSDQDSETKKFFYEKLEAIEWIIKYLDANE